MSRTTAQRHDPATETRVPRPAPDARPAPEGELAWVAAHGVLRRFDAGRGASRARGSRARGFHVFSGHLAIYVDRGEGRHKVLEWRGGDCRGFLALLPHEVSPGRRGDSRSRRRCSPSSGALPRDDPGVPGVTATLVHVMVDRARHFTSSDLHDEKMKSLGKLAAGLAHELNNPASAVIRSAKLAGGGAGRGRRRARAVSGGCGSRRAARRRWTRCATPALRRRRPGAFPRSRKPTARTPSPSGWTTTAPTTRWRGRSPTPPCTLAAARRAGRSLDGEVLDAALRWVAYGCAARSLAREIETADSRIHDLVASVKGFTYMDHAPTPEPVDVRWASRTP